MAANPWGERATGAAEDGLEVEYRGRPNPLFWLGLKTSALTLLTLGLYRFWEKTRLRRYFWSATAPGGDPLEYTGTGLEKLLGFLIAVAFLAIYLGLIQVALSFFGMSFLDIGDGTSQRDLVIQMIATYVSFFAVVPFIFYAQYRARRYILSRTRWRGIRFGAEAAAWGYVWRAIVHSLLTTLSLGLLLPRQTFHLEKYKVDRTWFGTARFTQEGRWQDLYPAMKHIFIALALILVPGLLAVLTDTPLWGVFAIFGLLWVIYGVVFYRVESFRIMGNAKRLGEAVRFRTTPSPARVFWTYVLGSMLASTCAGLAATAVFVVALIVMSSSPGLETVFAEMAETGQLGTSGLIALGTMALGYVGVLLLYGVFMLIFVSQPVLEHYARATVILNPAALEDISQRARDEMVEAEGFADALDVGAAI